MYQVDSATAATSFPAPAGVGPNPGGFFTNGNPGVVAATVVDQDILNAMMLELANAVRASGLTLSKTNQSQLASALQIFAGGYAADTGAVNALVATLVPVPASLAALTGAPIRVKVAVNNTGAATINVNALGATAIQNADGTALAANQLVAGGIATLVYNGTAFVLQSPAGYHPGFSNIAAYGFSTTFTVPAGVTRIRVQVVGGGGGGGGGNASFAGGGGAAGGYAVGIFSVTPGATYTVTIGAGGAGGGNGGTGGTTSFGSLISASGGSGGDGSGAIAAGGVPGTGAGSGTIVFTGGCGNDGNSSSGVGAGGAGGASFFGGGGRSGSGDGFSGTACGSGGGGCYGATGYGGAGAAGLVIVEY